jgi:Ser/Thr protein kinase RdoA (MazF antagonist)
VNGAVERLIGSPVTYDELKHKPGRRMTLRARGPRGSVIVKLYRSDRAASVAARISALAAGPSEPEVPRLLAVDLTERLLVLSDVSGVPLRRAVLGSDHDGCRRAGQAIAAWHVTWAGTKPGALREHTVEREFEVLARHAELAPPEIRRRLEAELPELTGAWPPATVVHRDLYEEQILLGPRVGLIDLDDAALGPAELDLGNLLAHLDLLELRSERSLPLPKQALLRGYATRGPLDLGLLERCRALTQLRLACIHREPRLLDAAGIPAPAGA